MYDNKELVSTVPGARKYYLSVRLNKEDIGKYLFILKWYGLDPASYEADNRSERFRMLLEKFCVGVYDWEGTGMPESYYEPIVTRPPLWRRNKEKA